MSSLSSRPCVRPCVSERAGRLLRVCLSVCLADLSVRASGWRSGGLAAHVVQWAAGRPGGALVSGVDVVASAADATTAVAGAAASGAAVAFVVALEGARGLQRWSGGGAADMLALTGK